jgi:hypothetical protein
MENVLEETIMKKSKLCVRLGILPQVVRVVTHVKDNLNSGTIESISNFKVQHGAVFAELVQQSRAVREATVESARSQLVEQLAAYKETGEVKAVLEQLKLFKKQQYRMNSRAINRLLVVVHQLLDDLVEYGLTSDQPKIYR